MHRPFLRVRSIIYAGACWISHGISHGRESEWDGLNEWDSVMLRESNSYKMSRLIKPRTRPPIGHSKMDARAVRRMRCPHILIRPPTVLPYAHHGGNIPTIPTFIFVPTPTRWALHRWGFGYGFIYSPVEPFAWKPTRFSWLCHFVVAGAAMWSHCTGKIIETLIKI